VIVDPPERIDAGLPVPVGGLAPPPQNHPRGARLISFRWELPPSKSTFTARMASGSFLAYLRVFRYECG